MPRLTPAEATTSQWTTALDDVGAVVVPGVLDDEASRRLQARMDELVAHSKPILAAGGVKTAFLDNGVTVDPSGGTTYITGLERDPELAEAVSISPIREIVAHLLRRPGSLVHLRYRAPKRGAGAQTLHRDAPGLLADGTWQSVTVILTLCDFAEHNGSLRVVPGSHRDHPDGFLARGPQSRHPREVILCAAAGSALVFSGGMLHSGTANRSDTPRPGPQALFA